MGRTNSTLSKLGTIGGVAALGCALIYLFAFGVNIAALRGGPPPTTTLQWLTLLQSNRITALFSLGVENIAIMILWAPMVLALYAALRRSNQAWSLMAAALVFVGIVVYLATNTVFSILALSQRYAAATTEAERSIVLAAAEAALAIHRGTATQYAGMPLLWLSGLILSAVMLRSQGFSRDTAWSGLLGMGLLLASIPVARYAPTWPPSLFVTGVVAFTYLGAGVLTWAWYLAVGWSLLKLARSERKTPAHAQG